MWSQGAMLPRQKQPTSLLVSGGPPGSPAMGGYSGMGSSFGEMGSPQPFGDTSMMSGDPPTMHTSAYDAGSREGSEPYGFNKPPPQKEQSPYGIDAPRPIAPHDFYGDNRRSIVDLMEPTDYQQPGQSRLQPLSAQSPLA